MARVKRGVTTHKRHKKILKLAKGFRGRAKNCYRVAVERVEKSLQYAYRDRKTKKRDFRSLWIARINAAARENGLKYSELINLLKKSDIDMDRKNLAYIAANNPDLFSSIVEKVKILGKASKENKAA